MYLLLRLSMDFVYCREQRIQKYKKKQKKKKKEKKEKRKKKDSRSALTIILIMNYDYFFLVRLACSIRLFHCLHLSSDTIIA